MSRAAGLLAGVVLAALAAFLLTGCATVQPWDRDLLADPAMSFNPVPMMGAIDSHIYFSTEGSTGGQEVDAGGCGCN